MGALYIALSVACSVTIAHLLKAVKKHHFNLLQVLTVNYLVAAGVSFITNPVDGFQLTDYPFVPLLAFVVGGVFIANFFMYSASLHRIGMGVSISAMRMSLVIPIGVSLFFYGEKLAWTNYLGMALVFVAFIIMLPKNKGSSVSKKDWLFPVFIFVFTGIADSILKVYEREFSNLLSEELFLSLIFSSAFILGGIYLMFSRNYFFSIATILYGTALGIANLYSSYFLLLALSELSGAITFSLVNILNVMVGTLIGVLIWKDELSIQQKAGISLALISILLLSL